MFPSGFLNRSKNGIFQGGKVSGNTDKKSNDINKKSNDKKEIKNIWSLF
jgi:hypothetical protein